MILLLSLSGDYDQLSMPLLPCFISRVTFVPMIIKGYIVTSRRQLCGVKYLRPPLPSFWGLKSGPQVFMPTESSTNLSQRLQQEDSHCSLNPTIVQM